MTFPTISELPALPVAGATGDDFNDPMIAFLEAMRDAPAEYNALSAAYAAYVESVLTAASTTSLAVGTGSKAFTIGTGYAYGAGTPVRATSRANIANYMDGTVASYSGGVLTVTVATIGGSGTYADWDIVPMLSGSGYITQGTHTLMIPAAAFMSRTTNGPSWGTSESSTNKVMSVGLDFDPATVEYAQISLPMPKSYNGGTITAQYIWSAGATGNAVWAMQAQFQRDDDVLDGAWGTAISVTDGVTATTDRMISAFSTAITPAGTWAAESSLLLQVYRDAASGSDTINSNDARLLSVRLKYTINAADDT
jgi:hypothetical protein